MGLRFFTDFLNNNVYFKTVYETHNLDRAINQFALINHIENKYQEIVKCIAT
mgnify:FL=1